MAPSTANVSCPHSLTQKTIEHVGIDTVSANESIGSGFQPYKASNLSDATKLMPPPPHTPYPPSAYNYPSTLYGGPSIHSYRYDNRGYKW